MIIKRRWLFTYILQDKELNVFGLIFFISGGIVGFSQNTNALEKQTLTAHLWQQYKQILKQCSN